LCFFPASIKTRDHKGQETNPLEIIIKKLRQQTSHSGPKRAIYEMSLVDIFADLPLESHAKVATNQIGLPLLWMACRASSAA